MVNPLEGFAPPERQAGKDLMCIDRAAMDWRCFQADSILWTYPCSRLELKDSGTRHYLLIKDSHSCDLHVSFMLPNIWPREGATKVFCHRHVAYLRA